MSFQDLWSKFPLIFGQLCGKKTCRNGNWKKGWKQYKLLSLQSEFCTWSSVCILYWPDWYFCFCSTEPRVWTEILELEENPSETILTAIIDMWTACWRAHEEKYNNAPLRGHSVRVLKRTRYGSPRCKYFGFSTQVAFWEVRKCDLGLLSLLNHINILILSTWVSELHRNYFWLSLSGEE